MPCFYSLINSFHPLRLLRYVEVQPIPGKKPFANCSVFSQIVCILPRNSIMHNIATTSSG